MSPIRPIAIVNARLITGDGATVLERAGILLAGGRIEAVVQTDRTPLSPDYFVIDGTGCTVLPGIINAHAHGCICGPSMPSGSAALGRDEVDYQRNRHLLSGTTTVLNVCGLALPDEIDRQTDDSHPLDIHISTGHTPASLAAAQAADGSGLQARHLSATVDDLLAGGAKALGEAGGGQTLGGGAQDYRFLPAAIEKACGLAVHPNLARRLKDVTLGRRLDGEDDPDGKLLGQLIEDNGLGSHFTTGSLSRLIHDTVMPPVALARQGLGEIAAEAVRTGMPAIFHNAAPTARQLVDLAKIHPGARIVAGHSNHPSFTQLEALETAAALRDLGASIDISTLDCISTRWRNGPDNLDALIEAGLVDTISTDFAGGDWDSILEAAHRLIQRGLLSPASAIAKAAGNVARIFPELAGDRGLIASGKRADIVVSQSHNLAHVRHVLCAGRIAVFNGALVCQTPIDDRMRPA